MGPSLMSATDQFGGLTATWQYVPLCAGLTLIGLVATVLVYRRRGLRSATRLLAWSLLPLGLGLVGAAKALWQIISALLSLVFHFAFSISGAIGAGLLALSLVLFVVTGAVGSRRLRRARRGTEGEVAGPDATAGARQLGRPGPAAGTSVAVPGRGQAAPGKGKSGEAGDPEMDEIEAILRNRGIS